MPKLLTLKKCKLTGDFIYYFTEKVRRPKVKRKHLKKLGWCYFCNYSNPCSIARIVKLKANCWSVVDGKLRRALGAARGKNPNLRIFWADLNIWE